MLDYGFYNMDCMDGMAQFHDKYFEIHTQLRAISLSFWTRRIRA